MTDRERLVDILYEGFYISPENDMKGTVQKAADYLIANGVTVQPQWISFEERLPEPHEEVLLYDETDNGIDRGCLSFLNEWYYQPMGHKVTHWMPLPEPPKGVE